MIPRFVSAMVFQAAKIIAHWQGHAKWAVSLAQCGAHYERSAGSAHLMGFFVLTNPLAQFMSSAASSGPGPEPTPLQNLHIRAICGILGFALALSWLEC
jgi:hypothetical protein